MGCRARARAEARDPAESIAAVALGKRALLLHLYRMRLRREDLEDCYSQAMLELVAFVRAGGTFANARHESSAIELRFASRVRDRRRALAGRSPMQSALESALALADGDGDGVSVADWRADVERVVLARDEMRRVRHAVGELTPDQRIALGAQLGPRELSASQLCSEYGWSVEKYRKLSQRGRTRLRQLLQRDEASDVRRAGPASK